METEEILDRAPLYAYNGDQNGYYDPDGRKLRELKHKRNNPGLRKNIDDSSRWRNIDRAFTQMEPGLKGDTIGRATKPATISTGYTLQVPLFVVIGDKIKIDTRTGEYLERAN